MNFPNLSGISTIGFDTETRDPALKEEGPGWARGYGNLVGVSIAVSDEAWYFPLRHTVNPEENYEIEPTLKFLKHILEDENVTKIGANSIYDMGWLSEDKIEVKGQIRDVLFAEALLRPNDRHSLESVSRYYGYPGKQVDKIHEWCEARYRGYKDHRANIYRTPPSVVREYAEEDARLPLLIHREQTSQLTILNLSAVYQMECDLIPMLVAMRQRGMPVDILKAEEVRDEMKLIEKLMRKQLAKEVGFQVNVNSGPQLAKAFDKLGLTYPKTKKGNPSFTASFLKQQHHPVASLINDIRRTNKARSTFIENVILEKAIGGKIYPSLHPLRSDEYGTITGRFSSSQPNGQQIPSRDEETAPLIRGMFVPEKGFPQWLKADYAQIEYRFFAHFVDAMLNDNSLVNAYRDPTTDFHDTVRDILGGEHLPRKPIKNINFMKLYGGGTDKTAEMIGDLDIDMTAKEFIELYETKFPQATDLLNHVANKAKNVGFITTILGRRTIFDLWAPPRGRFKALPKAQARREYGDNICRANTYKAINYMIQGSAADLMKRAMVDLWNSGLLDTIGAPHITVHDELNWSYHPDLKAEFKQAVEIMENALTINVPILADAEIGPDWGHCNEKF